MYSINMKIIAVFCLFFAVISFFSCSGQINGSLNNDGSASLSLNMSLGSEISGLIRRFSQAAGVSGDQILDSKALSESMSGLPGISMVLLKNTNPSAVEGTIRIAKIDDFLSASDGKRFITFEQSGSGGQCFVNLTFDDREQVLNLFTPDLKRYLVFLMAPVATGEKMTKVDYLDTIEAFYLKPIRNEIEASKVRMSIEFPGNITGVTGGTYSGRRAEFEIALADLLVLEKPIRLSAQW